MRGKCGDSMYLLFFALWVILNGKLTLEIALFGIGISAAMYFFICKFMDYSPKTELRIAKNFFRGIHYVYVLVCEIFKANFQVMHLILSSKLEVEPTMYYFKTKLKKESSKVALANSITLTPGTITVTLEDDEYCVHCLDKELAEGMDSSIFVQLLTKMEEV
ncbi:MAG: Na+/H+ antiporter subunit E [Clostridiales bacterium]|nr:Na+/H+ antiporter subunit E [Clostridiales bacterium]